jgi:hypothetical protein
VLISIAGGPSLFRTRWSYPGRATSVYLFSTNCCEAATKRRYGIAGGCVPELEAVLFLIRRWCVKPDKQSNQNSILSQSIYIDKQPFSADDVSPP